MRNATELKRIPRLKDRGSFIAGIREISDLKRRDRSGEAIRRRMAKEVTKSDLSSRPERFECAPGSHQCSGTSYATCPCAVKPDVRLLVKAD